jgi:hypothetical protein
MPPAHDLALPRTSGLRRATATGLVLLAFGALGVIAGVTAGGSPAAAAYAYQYQYTTTTTTTTGGTEGAGGGTTTGGTTTGGTTGTTTTGGILGDPVADAAALAKLLQDLQDQNYQDGKLTFTDDIPEAGDLLYGLDLSFYHTGGGGRAAAAKRPIHIGHSVTITVTKAGKLKVTVRIGPFGRRLLRHHHRARLVVRTFFITGVLHHHLNTNRVVHPRGRP